MQTVLITGAKQGLGYCTALALAKKNFRVLMADKQDLTNAKETIIKKSGNNNIEAYFMDLSSLYSIRSLANNLIEKEKNLHILINNAGVFCLGNEKSGDGLHPTMQVNHFGPFLLTYLLLDKLKSSAPSRIVFVTSSGAFFNNLTLDKLNDPTILPIEVISSTITYYNSKLCNIIASKGFAEKLLKYKVTSNCVHPGMTYTNFLLTHKQEMKFEDIVKPVAKKILSIFTQNVQHGADSILHLVTSKQLENISGKYFDNFQVHEQPILLEDRKFCDNIWKASKEYVGLDTYIHILK